MNEYNIITLDAIFVQFELKTCYVNNTTNILIYFQLYLRLIVDWVSKWLFHISKIKN